MENLEKMAGLKDFITNLSFSLMILFPISELYLEVFN